MSYTISTFTFAAVSTISESPLTDSSRVYVPSPLDVRTLLVSGVSPASADTVAGNSPTNMMRASKRPSRRFAALCVLLYSISDSSYELGIS